jgi:solute carrier family 44 protein 1 (choline transporter-like protein)
VFVILIFIQGQPELHYWAAPLFLVVVLALFIAHCFLSTYEMIIDTLYLCFAEDRDFADRTGLDEFADTEFKVLSMQGRRR